MDEIALAAPAKLNLGLRVLGRRPDGYHEIESLLLPLDFGDALHLRRRAGPGVELQLTGEAAQSVPRGRENLAWRAAQGFLEAAGLDFGVALRLEKRIPAPGGLGGGSSDAGAVLRGLCALAPGRADAGALRGLALSLGADVPFFLNPRPALVEGIGERIRPLDGLPALDVAIAHPRRPLATGAVYAAFAAAPPPPPRPPILHLLGRRAGPAAGGADGPGGAAVDGPERWLPLLPELLRNDLEATARRLCPAMVPLREALAAAGALAVGMSGSGPSVYGVFGSAAAARAAARKLADSGAWSRAARTLSGPAAGGESSRRGGRNAAE